ncbi:MAG: hypothetical protein KF767_07450 [Bdellovibrionaceae bacterium]|mgnify:CR=1 FL=1|nr:hypothetical protein [Pseudobdellovibrionaceae bacterium]
MAKRLVVFSLLSFTMIVAGCKSNPHKAEVLETKTEQESVVAGAEKLGVNADGDMVYQRKVMMAEEVRKLQNDVNEMEDKVYGTRKYNTKGLHGKYAECLRKLKTDQKADLPKLDKAERWADKNEDMNVGIAKDEKQLAGVTEEKLKDRIAKFQEYRRVLQDREDEYSDNIKNCEERRKTATN